MFGPWATVDAPGDAVLTVTAVTLHGPDDEKLFSTEGFSEENERRLAQLTAKFPR
jgi:hypothetical protein